MKHACSIQIALILSITVGLGICQSAQSEPLQIRNANQQEVHSPLFSDSLLRRSHEKECHALQLSLPSQSLRGNRPELLRLQKADKDHSLEGLSPYVSLSSPLSVLTPSQDLFQIPKLGSPSLFLSSPQKLNLLSMPHILSSFYEGLMDCPSGQIKQDSFLSKFIAHSPTFTQDSPMLSQLGTLGLIEEFLSKLEGPVRKVVAEQIKASHSPLLGGVESPSLQTLEDLVLGISQKLNRGISPDLMSQNEKVILLFLTTEVEFSIHSPTTPAELIFGYDTARHLLRILRRGKYKEVYPSTLPSADLNTPASLLNTFPRFPLESDRKVAESWMSSIRQAFEPGQEKFRNFNLSHAAGFINKLSPGAQEKARNWVRNLSADFAEDRINPTSLETGRVKWRETEALEEMFHNLAMTLDSKRGTLYNAPPSIPYDQDKLDYAKDLEQERLSLSGLTSREKGQFKRFLDYMRKNHQASLSSSARRILMGKGGSSHKEGLTEFERELLLELLNHDQAHPSELGNFLLSPSSEGLAELILSSKRHRKILNQFLAKKNRFPLGNEKMEDIESNTPSDNTQIRNDLMKYFQTHHDSLSPYDKQFVSFLSKSIDSAGRNQKEFHDDLSSLESGELELDTPTTVNQIFDSLRHKQQSSKDKTLAIEKIERTFEEIAGMNLPLSRLNQLYRLGEEDLVALADLAHHIPSDHQGLRQTLKQLILAPHMDDEEGSVLYRLAQSIRPQMSKYLFDQRRRRLVQAFSRLIKEKTPSSQEIDFVLSQIAEMELSGDQNEFCDPLLDPTLDNQQKQFVIQDCKNQIREALTAKTVNDVISHQGAKGIAQAKHLLRDLVSEENMQAFLESLIPQAQIQKHTQQHLEDFIQNQRGSSDPLDLDAYLKGGLKGQKERDKEMKRLNEMRDQYLKEVKDELFNLGAQLRHAQNKLREELPHDVAKIHQENIPKFQQRMALLSQNPILYNPKRYRAIVDEMQTSLEKMEAQSQQESLERTQNELQAIEKLADRYIEHHGRDLSHLEELLGGKQALRDKVISLITTRQNQRKQLEDFAMASASTSFEGKNEPLPPYLRILDGHLKQAYESGEFVAESTHHQSWEEKRKSLVQPAQQAYDKAHEKEKKLATFLKPYGISIFGGSIDIGSSEKLLDLDFQTLKQKLSEAHYFEPFMEQMLSYSEQFDRSKVVPLGGNIGIEFTSTDEGKEEFKFISIKERRASLEAQAKKLSELFEKLPKLEEQQRSFLLNAAKILHNMDPATNMPFTPVNPTTPEQDAELKESPSLLARAYGVRTEMGLPIAEVDRQLRAVEEEIAPLLEDFCKHGGEIPIQFQSKMEDHSMDIPAHELCRIFRQIEQSHINEMNTNFEKNMTDIDFIETEAKIAAVTAPLFFLRGPLAAGSLARYASIANGVNRLNKAARYAKLMNRYRWSKTLPYRTASHLFDPKAIKSMSKFGALMTNSSFAMTALRNSGAPGKVLEYVAGGRLDGTWIDPLNFQTGESYEMGMAMRRDEGHWEGDKWITDEWIYQISKNAQGEMVWNRSKNRTGALGADGTPDYLNHKKAEKLRLVMESQPLENGQGFSGPQKIPVNIDMNNNQIPDEAEDLYRGPLLSDNVLVRNLPTHKDFVYANRDSQLTFLMAGPMGKIANGVGARLGNALGSKAIANNVGYVDNMMGIFGATSLQLGVMNQFKDEEQQLSLADIGLQALKNSAYAGPWDDLAALYSFKKSGWILTAAQKRRKQYTWGTSVNMLVTQIGTAAEVHLTETGYYDMNGVKRTGLDAQSSAFWESLVADIMASRFTGVQAGKGYATHVLKAGETVKSLEQRGWEKETQMALEEIRLHDLDMKSTRINEEGQIELVQEPLLRALEERYGTEINFREQMAELQKTKKEGQFGFKGGYKRVVELIPQREFESKLDAIFEKNRPLNTVLANVGRIDIPQDGQVPSTVSMLHNEQVHFFIRQIPTDRLTHRVVTDKGTTYEFKSSEYELLARSVAAHYKLPEKGFLNYLQSGRHFSYLTGKAKSLEQAARDYGHYHRNTPRDAFYESQDNQESIAATPTFEY